MADLTGGVRVNGNSGIVHGANLTGGGEVRVGMAQEPGKEVPGRLYPVKPVKSPSR